MLPGVSELTRIRLLLELGKNKLRPTYSQEAHLDSALWYFSQAEGLSKRLGSQPWQEESQILTGVAYLFKGDCERSQAWFRRVIGARQRAGDQSGRTAGLAAVGSDSVYLKGDAPTALMHRSRAFTLARSVG